MLDIDDSDEEGEEEAEAGGGAGVGAGHPPPPLHGHAHADGRRTRAVPMASAARGAPTGALPLDEPELSLVLDTGSDLMTDGGWAGRL